MALSSLHGLLLLQIFLSHFKHFMSKCLRTQFCMNSTIASSVEVVKELSGQVHTMDVKALLAVDVGS